MREKPVFRVVTHPIQDYSDKAVLDILVSGIIGKSLPEFVHDVRINKDKQYDELFVKEDQQGEKKAL